MRGPGGGRAVAVSVAILVGATACSGGSDDARADDPPGGSLVTATLTGGDYRLALDPR